MDQKRLVDLLKRSQFNRIMGAFREVMWMNRVLCCLFMANLGMLMAMLVWYEFASRAFVIFLLFLVSGALAGTLYAFLKATKVRKALAKSLDEEEHGPMFD